MLPMDPSTEDFHRGQGQAGTVINAAWIQGVEQETLDDINLMGAPALVILVL
jgi:hypothetical protein